MAQLIHIPRGGSVDSTATKIPALANVYSDNTLGLEFTAGENGCYRLILNTGDALKLLHTITTGLQQTNR